MLSTPCKLEVYWVQQKEWCFRQRKALKQSQVIYGTVRHSVWLGVQGPGRGEKEGESEVTKKDKAA